ncbi:MAG TPA: MFS transporter, partial [Rhizobiaceae bacterium]|nr:MFS transporter [Rhizobiaceae bacterium]
SLAAMAVLLPRTNGKSAAPAALRDEVRVLGRQQVWTSLILMLMLMIGQFVPYTYIAPLLQQVTGLDVGLVPWVLLLNGVGCTLGVFIGGKFSDARLMPAMIAFIALQVLVLIGMYFAAPYPLPMIAIIFIWGCVNFSIGTPIQTRILTWTADAPNLASSLIPSGFNIGIALAASLGAALLTAGVPYRSLPLFGVASMLIAVVVATSSYLAEKRSGATPPRTTNATA